MINVIPEAHCLH